MPRARTFRQGPQRSFIWSDILVDSFVVGLGSAKVAGTATGLIVSGVTLIRTRGHLNVHFDPASIGDVIQVAVGLGIYSSDAFAVGSTALPGPITDADYDWIWHNVMTMGPAFSATETGVDILSNKWVEVDSKAMRKLKPNQTVGWMLEALVLSGGGTVDIAVAARQLFKLG